MPTTQYAMEPVADRPGEDGPPGSLQPLSILEHAVQLIEQRHGMRIALEDLEDGDPKTFEELGRGETFGAFQRIGRHAARDPRLQPTSVDDLAALVALYRPGPMQHIGAFCRSKHGLEPVSYPHPDLSEILDPTYGIIVFQDQVLKIAQVRRLLAGRRRHHAQGDGQEDRLRHAGGARALRQGRIELGYSEADAEKVFGLIEPFAAMRSTRRTPTPTAR